jgi:hypothetical protein
MQLPGVIPNRALLRTAAVYQGEDMSARVVVGVSFLAASLLGCAMDVSDPSVAVALQPVILEPDGRSDVYQVAAPAVLRNVDGVALMTYTSSLSMHDGVVDLPVTSLQQAFNVCGSERFAAQPRANADRCTAYLVAPRLVVTAGHCVDFAPAGSDISQYSLIFGFQMLDPTTARTTFAASDVYTTLRVNALCDELADCAVLELDRPVTNHTMLQLRRSGEPTTADSVYTLGHPFGLPLKYDAPEAIYRVAINTLISTLDVAGGNSGSPLINAETHLVEGTLNGFSGGAGVVDLDATEAGCNIEHRANPDDNYFSTGWIAATYQAYVPAYCAGDAAGWAACAADGCSICTQRLDTTQYDRYLQNHPNCRLEAACGNGFSACSEACPEPSATDSSSTPPEEPCKPRLRTWHWPRHGSKRW